MNLKQNETNKKVIPIFYACDDAFVKYTMVSIKSLIENASKDYKYKIYILNTTITQEMKDKALELNEVGFEIIFVNVRDCVDKISDKFPIRDYYSKTTYFRLYIPELFPQYDKAIYIDSDTVVLGDVSKLYNTEIGGYYVGACHEQAMVQTDVYGTYVEKVLGIDRNNYFNAGVLLLNCKIFRDKNLLKQFTELLSIYTFIVTQDQDYLNVMCQDKVLWLDQGWNTEAYGNVFVPKDKMNIIHYIMTSKPWHYQTCMLKEYFWEYAEKVSVYQEILDVLNSYTDEQRERDYKSCERLSRTAKEESERLDTYCQLINSNYPERLKVLEKIRRLELTKKFDQDVEDDPETITLLPNKVDYLGEKYSSKIFTKVANRVATAYYEKEIKKGNMVIKEIKGIENYSSVEGGAFITCNHFSPYDNYAVWRAIRPYFKKGKRLFKVIREGNYTNFKGLYGFFFRHCNTLPLSSNTETMKKFLKSVDTLISRGEKILIYPEQAMWWNYRKPRPLKSGAFKMAAKNNAPVIPCFISMENTDKIGPDGYPVQAYTVWFLPPLKADENLSVKEKTDYLMLQNSKAWKEIYEKVYKTPLVYGE